LLSRLPTACEDTGEPRRRDRAQRQGIAAIAVTPLPFTCVLVHGRNPTIDATDPFRMPKVGNCDAGSQAAARMVTRLYRCGEDRRRPSQAIRVMAARFKE
jgi:hypothetical protein